MPKVEKKRLPCLTVEQVQTVLAACNNGSSKSSYHNPRDKAVILLMVDTGLRRSEVIALNWGDVDIATGLARVTRGKGGKARSVVIGFTTRRALLAYRRTLEGVTDNAPLIQTREGGRFTGDGLLQLWLRLRQP